MTSMQELKSISNELRKELLIKHSESKMAHIGSDFSCLDILITIYFKVLQSEDRFVLSKGHAALALYAVLHKKGIMSNEVYNSLGKNGSLLGEHPIYGIEGIEFATGSLGHGLPISAGMALAKRFDKNTGKIYVLLSDGECQEGSTLEAMNFIARLGLNNLVAIVDSNKWQAFDRTLLPGDKIKSEFISAGWLVKEIDGHNYEEIHSALKSSTDSPTLIIANTVLGKGVKSMEDRLEWHYKSPTKEQVNNFNSEVL